MTEEKKRWVWNTPQHCDEEVSMLEFSVFSCLVGHHLHHWTGGQSALTFILLQAIFFCPNPSHLPDDLWIVQGCKRWLSRVIFVLLLVSDPSCQYFSIHTPWKLAKLCQEYLLYFLTLSVSRTRYGKNVCYYLVVWSRHYTASVDIIDWGSVCQYKKSDNKSNPQQEKITSTLLTPLATLSASHVTPTTLKKI